MNILALTLIILGALNWGLWGFFQFDLVAWIFHGNTIWLSRIVYSIIGLAGIWGLRFFCKCKPLCCCHDRNKNDSCCNDKDKNDKGSGGCCKL